MRISARAAALALPVLLAAAGCGGGGDGDDGAAPSATATTSTRAPLPTTTTTSTTTAPKQPEGVTLASTRPEIDAEVRDLRLVRVDDETLALQFALAATGDEKLYTLDTQLSENDTSFLPVAVYLFDAPRSAVYAPATGTPLEDVDPGDELAMTILYAAPPAEVDSMLVVMPTFEAADVEISTDPVDVPDLPAGDPLVVPATAPIETAVPGQPVTLSFALSGDVLFEFGSADLSPAAAAALEGVADQLPSGGGTLTVAGHTDSIGDDASNQVLSEQRANTVAAYLQGVVGSDVSIVAVGYGETQPVAPNETPDGADDPDGRARNRRVDLTYSGTTAGAASDLEVRDLGHKLADAGLVLTADPVERTGTGATLLRFEVRNASSQAVQINADSERFADIQDGLCYFSLLDSPNHRRTYPFHFFGATSNDFCMSTLDATIDLEPGDARQYVAVMPEPLPGVTSVTIEAPSFGTFAVPVEG